MDIGGFVTGIALIVAGGFIAKHHRETATGINDYFINIRAGQKRAYRGRFAWLAAGIPPSLARTRILTWVLIVAAIAAGAVFIIGSA